MCFDGFDLKDANNACEQVGVKNAGGTALFVPQPAPGPPELPCELRNDKLASENRTSSIADNLR